MSKVQPMRGRVLIKRLEEEKESKGGIIIPESAQEQSHRGEVIAVGLPSFNVVGKEIPYEFKKGNKIIFERWTGAEITVDGIQLIIMKDVNILAIVN